MRTSYNFFQNYHKAAAEFANGDMAIYGRLMFIINTYGIDGAELDDLTPVEKLFFTSVKASIDKSIELSDARAKAGKKGGQGKKSAPVDTTEETTDAEEVVNKSNTNDDLAKNNLLNQKNICLSEEEREREREKEIEKEVEREREITPPDSVLTLNSPALSRFSHNLFELFKNAGLPCANNNELSFMQRDFKNTLAFIHGSAELRGLHSDEIEGAVKNYIDVLSDEESYITNRYSLERLVKLKNFSDYLPANFVKDNFKKFKREDEKPAPQEFKPAVDIMAKLKAPKTCINCAGPVDVVSSAGGFYAVKCCNCGSWAEYNLNEKYWDWSRQGA